MLNGVGVVVIGRNEGDRLIRCLKSLSTQSIQLVYVDSASTDNSIKVARNMGVKVLSLDMTIPFTAARARNEGYEQMRKLFPQADYVQFVDGDCEIAAKWLESAVNYLKLHHDISVVCGRIRERYPERTVYNMLCDIEWNTPVGEVKACGGIALMRVDAFKSVGGFRSNMIAGEESELCLRLRTAGWKVWHLDAEMALHDAAMTRFGQWWKRSMRSGYAYAEGAHLHGSSPEMHRVIESRRIWTWGLVIPIISLCVAIWLGAWGLVILLTYPAQILRLALRGTRSAKKNWLHALFLVLGKFPEVIGQLNFFYNRLFGKTARLIEYK